MSVLGLLAGLAAFVMTLRVLRAQHVATDVIGAAQQAVGVMTDPALTDDEKEVAVRRSSLRLFGYFLRILGIAVAALGASALLVCLGAAAGLYALGDAIAIATGWPFILASSAAAILAWIAVDRVAGGEAPDRLAREVPFSPLDMALHDFAFASPARQRRLARVENRLFSGHIDERRARRPVFVTSLPRAGTTMLLRALSRQPELASPTYRHMPFTLAPLLWGGLSPLVRRSTQKSERAHGDGIEVDLDSPEAFEEMVWMVFWPGHYEADRIRPWDADDRDPEFEAFLRTHMAKVVAKRADAARYLSKNNANIARLPLLHALYPDAAVVVPVREPTAQVTSLLRQHRRFTDLHAREPFARRYMEGVGHFEFGAALKPIAFPGAPTDTAEADHVDFWLRYWIAAYEHVLATSGPATIFVDHDGLSAAPETHLAALGEAVGLDAPGALVGEARAFRPPRPAPDLPGASPPLVARAWDLHAELVRRSIGGSVPEERRA